MWLAETFMAAGPANPSAPRSAAAEVVRCRIEQALREQK